MSHYLRSSHAWRVFSVFSNRTRLRASALAVLLMGFVILPSVRSAGQLAPEQEEVSPPATANDVFAEIGRRAQGFGGIFVDEEKDTLYVYVVGGSPDFAAVVDKAITDVLGPDRPPAHQLVVLQGQYTFLQLKEWYDRMSMRALAIPGAVLTAIDHKTNRLEVGVQTMALEPSVAAVLAALGIPREAVLIKEVAPIEAETLQEAAPQIEEASADAPCPAPGCTLQSKIRPLVGGIQIQDNMPPPGFTGFCTLGFIAVRVPPNVALGFVTASHCTNVQGGVEGTMEGQPTWAGNGDTVATEKLDSCYWTPAGTPFPFGCTPAPRKPTPPCPVAPVPGYNCRYSDSAFFALKTNVTTPPTTMRGFIARPDSINPSNPIGARCGPPGTARPLCNLDWTMPTYFQVIREGNVMVVGETVTKVGRTTGWTQGKVSLVGMTVMYTGVSKLGTPTQMAILSANQADPNNLANPGYWSLGGDSGSPVFQCLDSSNNTIPCSNPPVTSNVRIVGVHFASGGSFSSIGDFKNSATTGVQELPYELGPLIKCIDPTKC